jgi:hypothetical protein
MQMKISQENKVNFTLMLKHPIKDKGHNGSIATIRNTYGLCNPLVRKHTMSLYDNGEALAG